MFINNHKIIRRKERISMHITLMNHKIRIFFFGIGKKAENILGQIKSYPENVEILGVVDNDSNQWGEKNIGEGRRLIVYSPQILHEFEFDKLIIMSDSYEEIKDSLVYWHHIDEEKIEGVLYLLKLLLLDKYGRTEDLEIQEILKFWNHNEISIFNQYIKKDKEKHIVYWDYVENLPYIIFEDKKMYFPFDYKFQVVDGKKVIMDILGEQQDTSPHLYIKDNITVENGDVVADVGVQEGNFSLRYIEKISKLYLFEADKRWIKPLKKTYEKFREKVVFCDKKVSIFDGRLCTNLDSIIDGRLDFLKMDIEGNEVDALFGAKKTLLNNNVKCSVCCYHKCGDEEAIKDIFHAYGYQTDHSNGYMLYYFSKDFFSTLDLRRGIIYAKKG